MDSLNVPSTSGCSKPLHVRRLEETLNICEFLQENRKNVVNVSSDDEDYIGVSNDLSDINYDELLHDTEDMGDNDILNTDYVDMERSWLTDVMQEDLSQEEDSTAMEDINLIVKMHAQHKKIAASTPIDILEQHMYYGAGILSNFDKYPENKQTIQVTKGKVRKAPLFKSSNYAPNILHDMQDELDLDLDYPIDVQTNDDDIKLEMPIKITPTSTKRGKTKKFKDDESKKKWEDLMLQKRRKIFSGMVKKEIGKQQRSRVTKHKELVLQARKVAMACQKVARNKALQSARAVKELQWRMKRLSRENLAYWKRSKRVDREMRRKLEKEAEEQRKIDFELIEAKRQQRKLNFLITQTELYAHFMSKKLGEVSPEEQLRILSQLDEERIPRLATIDDYDSDAMKAKAIKNAQDAFQSEKYRTKQFDMEVMSFEEKSFDIKKVDSDDFCQPAMFRGTLKAYQLRGMNWLANLYDQGISGILADEMGLGKTVQSIAFLSHLAEEQDLWGPYLVICPASTLHNWQQEFAKFTPNFKVVPYWGNPADRKILRQFWAQDGMHTKDAGFHVVITSYQIVISDVKYFNRIKWQYMVLDEAQAIKSTSSMRWKTLLGFNCRNRLLLSGTPIQNSMAELWALLHFIMPTLFDSHEEFNEWFSKDIESHAENKTGIDEKHLSRLHMILKPFMLRRIKKDVENELSDKIEIMVYCPLTTRQRLLYMALKQKIQIEDLLHYTVGGGDTHSVDKNFTSNLMNLVMQFRKVCNHPELFERRDAKSPIFLKPHVYEIPYLVYDTNIRSQTFERLQKSFLFTKTYITNALNDPQSLFTIFLCLKLSVEEIHEIMQGNIVARWANFFDSFASLNKQYHNSVWSNSNEFNLVFSALFKLSFYAISASDILKKLVFTFGNAGSSVIYTHSNHSYYSMPETIEHRNIRCRIKDYEPEVDVLGDGSSARSIEFRYEARSPEIFECQKTEMPAFLFTCMLKVCTQYPTLYCYSRRAAYDYKKHLDDWSWTSLNYRWSVSTKNELVKRNKYFYPVPRSPVDVIAPLKGWSYISIPDKETLVTDSGKLFVLDGLLKRLKEEGHRVLIYSQMTKMIDLLEEYMWHRHHKYMRLDGSSKISERRDMVADFQARADIFVFLLSTRAGGLGINLTAADTVIFYDSDWNPTVDQQAMDRAHRLGQTKQVTVYRLICKGSIEERILQRAREKSEIQNLVISGGSFKPETLKPKEVVSLLLDDEEIELKYRQRAEERKHVEDMREIDRKRKYAASFKPAVVPPVEPKKPKLDTSQESGIGDDHWLSVDSVLSSPHSENSADLISTSDDLTDGLEIVDTPWDSSKMFNMYSTPPAKSRAPPRGSSKRGRPRGSRRISALGRFNSNTTNENQSDSNANAQYPSYDNPVQSSSQTSTLSGSSGYSSITSTRRGPGRPRLKPAGPPNSGTRGTYRPRKPARPLPVPLPSDGNATYSYINYPDQSDI